MKKIYIRTDANSVIATGHMMRCITIADELKKRGIDIEFIVSDEESATLLKPLTYKYTILYSDWNHLNNEIERMRVLLEKSTRTDSLLLVDSYYADNAYYQSMKEFCKIAIIDDLGDERYDVDLIINYAIYFSKFKYEEKYIGSKTKLLLGTRYVPLRKQFIETDTESRDTDINYLFICGGGDPLNVLNDIVDYGLRNDLFAENRRYGFVLGAYNQYVTEISNKVKNKKNIVVLKNVSNMAMLMRSADIIISAASTVLYEACAVGTPIIFYCMADNQENDGKYFCKETKMIYVGDFRYQRSQCVENIYHSLEYLDSNHKAQRLMRSNMRRIADGYGAARIAEELIKL